MKKTLKEIANLVGGKLVGDCECEISGLSAIESAASGDLTFVGNSKYVSLISKTKASAILVSADIDVSYPNQIIVDNPSFSFSQVAAVFAQADAYCISGIHSTACIDESVALGDGVAVGAHAVIEPGVVVGDHSVIEAGCFLGYKTHIGANSVLRPNVTVTPKNIIGNRVVIHSGTVVGSDGFGYEFVDGVHKKIPQIGNVVIEDDVEIGANVAIDRARFDKTLIGKGTKIDNLVQIAHNVIIGEGCILLGQSGISGSSRLEKGVILAGQSGVVGHLTIGAGSVVAAKSVVTKSLSPNSKVLGFPAKPMSEAKRAKAAFQRLPKYIKKINELEKRIQELEER